MATAEELKKKIKVVMFDQYGTALHAGHNPGYPASHGCVRLPSEFAKRLYAVTDLGATVMIGA